MEEEIDHCCDYCNCYVCKHIKEHGKKVKIITPSENTKKICEELGLTVIPTQEAEDVKVAFDGCDQVDHKLNAYKSGGGIHTKEKIIAQIAEEYVLLVDETKVVEDLNCKVPIVLEIIPEAMNYVTKKSKELGAAVKVRDAHLLELYFEQIKDLKKLDKELKVITGVVETSLFYQIATKAIIAGIDGIKIIER